MMEMMMEKYWESQIVHVHDDGIAHRTWALFSPKAGRVTGFRCESCMEVLPNEEDSALVDDRRPVHLPGGGGGSVGVPAAADAHTDPDADGKPDAEPVTVTVTVTDTFVDAIARAVVAELPAHILRRARHVPHAHALEDAQALARTLGYSTVDAHIFAAGYACALDRR